MSTGFGTQNYKPTKLFTCEYLFQSQIPLQKYVSFSSIYSQNVPSVIYGNTNKFKCKTPSLVEEIQISNQTELVQHFYRDMELRQRLLDAKTTKHRKEQRCLLHIGSFRDD